MLRQLVCTPRACEEAARIAIGVDVDRVRACERELRESHCAQTNMGGERDGHRGAVNLVWERVRRTLLLPRASYQEHLGYRNQKFSTPGSVLRLLLQYFVSKVPREEEHVVRHCLQ